ncbi:MAG: DNA polymerase III subunit [Candidatus Paceibacterota bacterium]|jgi:DNA polymerase-3 subunit delta'|nr:DNA polymerase III subunit [Candidatus Paceibacterota bacterium]
MEIIGHKKQWEFLKLSADSNKLSHAYLFHGPSQIGKKRIAIELAKYLHCKEKNAPCNACKTCLQIGNGLYSDVLLIEPEEGKKSISIDQIRSLRDKMAMSSINDGYKVAIIDNAHLMTFEAQSALLKQLEEPKGKKIFILVSEYPQNLLTTIVSRCQQVRFDLIDEKVIEKNLGEKINFSENISIYSLGRPGLAINILEKTETGQIWSKRIEEIENAKKQNLYDRFEYAAWLSKEVDLDQTFEIWLSYFRQLMKNYIIKSDYQAQWGLDNTRKIINSLQNYQYLSTTAPLNTRLTLELFLLDI